MPDPDRSPSPATLRRGHRPGWIRAVVVLAAATLLAAACTDDTDGSDGTADPAPADLSLAEDAAPGVDLDGEPLLRPSTGAGRDAAVAWRDAPYEVEVKGGGAYVGHELLSSPDDSEIPWVDPGDEPASVSFTAERTTDDTISVTVRAPEAAGASQLSVSFECGPDERFFGLGAQSWATEHRGETVPIWVVEQGLGKITPDTPEPVPSLLGEPYDSYAPIPFFASSRGYGVSYEGPAYGTFELCTEEHPDTWRLETWADEITFHVIAGPEMLDVVEHYTELAGRSPTLPPDWFFAPMNDAVRGQENVRRVADLIRDNDIASSVIWTEDWIGVGSQRTGFRLSHDWDVSETEYPDLRGLTDGLHDDGFRFLGYVSPFIPTDETTPGGPDVDQNGDPVVLQPHNQEKWAEAVEGGYAFTDPSGEPYLMLTPPFAPPGGAGLDVTEAEAIEWFQGYLEEAEALGLDGSMTDFGEWVPFDAQFADGSTGADIHNRYPLLWQQANREFWDEARPDGDFLFYVRSGFTGTQRYAPAFWGGDQNTTYDRLDGLGSVVTLGVNLGLSGIAFYGHDIAGYSAFAIEGVENTPTDKELFLRWASIGAYTPMMRTHHGSRYGENWSFEGAPNPEKPEEPLADPETLEIWKRLAAEHISLFPYQQAYGQEAVDRGLPIMRHPLLVVPDDPVFAGELPAEAVWDEFDSVGLPEGETFQYFLGDELLVAPVIDEGVTTRPVHLPAGEWVDIRSGERFDGPATVVAEAEPGDIPVYAPAGAVIPRLPDGVETLAPSDDPDIVDHTDVADELVIDVVAGSEGSFTLVDGTRITLRSESALAGSVSATVDGDEVEVSRDEGLVIAITPEVGDTAVEFVDDEGNETTIEVSGAPLDRSYTVRLLG